MTDEHHPAWCRGVLLKRTPDAIRVMVDLVEDGVRNGECSALDVRDVHFDQPNVIGSVFKILHRLGFTHTDRRVKSKVKRKHARRVDVWELTDSSKARTFLDAYRGWIIANGEQQAPLLPGF